LGGAPVFPEVLALCRGLKPKKLAVGFGMTEGVATLVNVKDANAWKLDGEGEKEGGTGDVASGIVSSGARVRICPPRSRVPLSRGQLGELHQGGLPVFSGYLGVNHEACYQEDGVNWIATGDQAYMDEAGYVYITGRYKDLIIRGGENISSVKIENYLRKVKGVVDVRHPFRATHNSQSLTQCKHRLKLSGYPMKMQERSQSQLQSNADHLNYVARSSRKLHVHISLPAFCQPSYLI
jgi:acyl-CoA synthetase (AMP-forming)/AMP-acid ligase II